jgi:uncharacterized RDD family membrane protein YckC
VKAAPFLASPLMRVAGGAIDAVVCVMAILLAMAAVGGRGGMPRFAALASGVYILYHVAFFWYLDDSTPGQRAWSLRTVSASGGPLSFLQTLIRPGIRALLVCVFAWSADFFWPRLGDPYLWLKSALAPLLLEAGMMFTLPSRQTLSDLVARTLVVNIPPPQPHRAPAGPMYSGNDAEFGLPPKR